MKPVNQAEFFAIVGSLNVDVVSLKGRYHVSHWELQNGSREIIGWAILFWLKAK